MYKSIIIFLIREFLYNGHLQSFGAFGLFYITCVLIGITPTLRGLSLIYLIFQCVYYFDRYSSFSKDIQTNKVRSDHVKLYYKHTPFIIGLLVIIISLLSYEVTDKYFVFLSLFIVFAGFMYPLYVKGLTRLIFIMKNIYVSLVFAIVPIFTGIFYDIKLPLKYFIILSIYIFIETVLMQMTLDLKDIGSDKLLGLKTLAVSVGKKKAIKIIKNLSFGFALVFIGLSFYLKDYYLALFVIISLVVNLISLELISKNNHRGFFLTAGKFILWFLLLIVIKWFNARFIFNTTI